MATERSTARSEAKLDTGPIEDWRGIQAALAAPFPFSSHDYRVYRDFDGAQGPTGLVVFYIQSRDVMDRLDRVVGVEGWNVHYEYIHSTSGSQEWAAHLTVNGVTKTDVGLGNDAKSAVSDALKRAGVLFGIGRYLYSSDQVFVPLDKKGKYAKITREGHEKCQRVLRSFLAEWAVEPTDEDEQRMQQRLDEAGEGKGTGGEATWTRKDPEALRKIRLAKQEQAFVDWGHRQSASKNGSDTASKEEVEHLMTVIMDTLPAEITDPKSATVGVLQLVFGVERLGDIPKMALLDLTNWMSEYVETDSEVVRNDKFNEQYVKIMAKMAEKVEKTHAQA